MTLESAQTATGWRCKVREAAEQRVAAVRVCMEDRVCVTAAEWRILLWEIIFRGTVD